ncbi:MAG: hypothetical protein IJJ24_00350 [Solobacterium sp.]|nr:hypothetical protein [Solobacterium sp.]
MSFSNLNIKMFYEPPQDNPVVDFFIPVLKEAVQYDRGTAYFSSKALYEMTVGVAGLVKNGGRIRYIISPENLSQEDIDPVLYRYFQKTRLESFNII